MDGNEKLNMLLGGCMCDPGSSHPELKAEKLVQVLKPKQVRSVWNESGTGASFENRAGNLTHG